MESLKNKRIGLALSGGSVLGAAHIGVLKALNELGIEVHAIAGTSIGSLIAALYAFGKSVDELTTIAADLEWNDITDITVSKYGLLKNDKLGELVKRELNNAEFKDATIPLSMIATNISSGEKVILNSGNVSKAVQASACIPGIFVPVTIDGEKLVDGGIVENVPFSALDKDKLDVIIAVDLISQRKYHEPTNAVDILIHSFHYMISHSTKHHGLKANITIQPDLTDFSMVDIHRSKELIQKGYEEAMNVLKNSTQLRI